MTGNAMPLLTKKRVACAAVAGIVAFAVYCFTLAPTVTGEDSGELISASYCMGVAHPPGYPLWSILAKMWMTILPVGEVAWRTNLLSALLGAISVSMLVFVAVEAGFSLRVATVGALLFAFSRTFWSQSVITEVYTLAVFTTLACVLAVLRFENTGRVKYAYAAAFLFGVTATGHQMIVVLVPSLLFLALTRTKEILKPSRLAAAVTLSVIPLSLFLYLLFCARGNPPINWGNPNTLGRLWHHFMRSQYPSVLTKDPRSAGIFLRQMGVLLDAALKEFHAPLLAMAPAGLVLCWRCSGARRMLFLCSVAFFGSVGVMLLLNQALTREMIHALDVFLLYAWIVVALLVAAGIDGLPHILPWRWRTAPAAGVLRYGIFAAAIVLMAVWNFGQASMRGNYLAHDYAVNMLKTMEPDAVIFPGGDHNTFPLLYCVVVEGKRSDITMADKYGYIEESFYQEMPGDFPEIPDHAQRMEILSWILARETRPVYFSTSPNLPGAPVKQVGLLHKAVKPGEDAPDQEKVWSTYSWRNLTNDRMTLATADYTSEMIMSDYCQMKAGYLLESGRVEDGEAMLRESARYGRGVKEILNNLGSLAAENNLTEIARNFFMQSIELDPTYVTPRKNLDIMDKVSAEKLQPPQAPVLPTAPQPPDPLEFLPGGGVPAPLMPGSESASPGGPL